MPFARSAEQPALDVVGQWRLFRMVYEEPRMLWANLVLVAFIGLLCVAREPTWWLFVWTASGLVIALLRLVEFYDFRRRRWADGQLGVARWRYVAGAWLLAAHWGAADLCLVLTDDRTIQLWLLTTQVAVLASAVPRSSPVMLASKGYVMLSLLPMLAACLSSGNGGMALFGLMALLFIVASLRQAASLHDQSVRFLAAEEANVALIQSVSAVNAELAAANAQLSALARIDGLTGLANRRFFDESLRREYDRCARLGAPLSLVLIDIDHFKAFNDTHGHPAGDECLRQVAATIRDSTRRPGDVAARYGGEEFACILPSTDTAGATEIAEHIRREVQRLTLAVVEGRSCSVTISAGVATIGAPARATMFGPSFSKPTHGCMMPSEVGGTVSKPSRRDVINRPLGRPSPSTNCKAAAASIYRYPE